MKRLIPLSPLRIFSIFCSIGLIVLIGSLLTFRSSASAMMITLAVNSTADSVDANPGDGVCADSLNRCTLRAAVMEANASSGPNTITVPPGTYTLTLGPFDNEFNFSGADEGTGDIDVLNHDLTITGAGSASTIIDGGGIDRIFDVNDAAGSGIAVNFTLQGLTLRNGNAPTTPEGFFEAGGAIQFDGTNFPNPEGTLTINNCRIINSTASGLGGGIFATSATVNINGSEISGNTTVHANGGGIVYDGGIGAPTQSLHITNSNISNNNAPNATFGSGGGLWVGGGSSKTIKYNSIIGNHAGAKGGGVFNGNGNLDLSYNAIVSNTASGDATSTGFRNNSGTASVENDWWGCNQGPGLSPCDRASGAVGFGILHWLTLSHTANPNTINRNTSTTLQADFYTNNVGSAIAPSDLVGLNGRPVTFNNPVLGTISGADAQINNGKANATFNAGAVGGNGSADATVDHATVTANITINQEPSVTTNPTDQTACEGGSVSFTASSNGFPTPTVQWQVGAGGGPFTDIPGATNATLTFNATAAQNGNKYRAVFSNGGGTATSTAATLTVNTAPTVTTNPTDQTACEGASVSFTSAANGSPAPTVQWQVSTNGGGSFSNIVGANSTTLTFNAAATQNGNKYRAVFTNSCSAATSTAATLTVNPSTSATTPSDQTACQGATANFSTTASGTGPFHYAWTVDGSTVGDDSASISLATNAFTVGNHTVSVIVNGTCGNVTRNATLTVQENTSATAPVEQTVCQGANASFSTTASGTGPFHYAWTVDGSSVGGDSASVSVSTGSLSATTHSVSVTVSGTCGSITRSTALNVQENTSATAPADETVCQGAPASFSTTASGTGPFHYAWTVDGSAVGGDSASVSVSTGSLSVGNHAVSVTVGGTCGSVVKNATLTVQANTAATAPSDQTVCQGANASFSTTASGTGPFHYAWTVDGSTFGSDTSSISVPTGSLTVGSHAVSVTVSGTCGSATQNANLAVQENTSATALNDQTVCQGANASFSTTASGTGPFHYAWTVDGSSVGGDSASVTVSTASLSVGNHAVAVTVSGACGSVTKNATLTVQETTTATIPNDQTVCQGANASFSTTASGTGPFHYAWTVDGSSVGGDSASVSVATGSLSGGSHNVAVTVSGACGSVTRTATLNVNTSPVVTTNPASQTVISGNATFTAAASGIPTPTVQWQVSTNGGASFSNIAGATSTTLTFATNSSQNGNQYRAVFSNACGTATTSAATLTTCSPPVVTTNPNSVADACVGQVITFTANATGTPAPTVQWQVSTNGGSTYANIAGATSNTLSVTASVAVRNNKYRAVFTNACGTEYSSAATLGVDTVLPVITVNHPTLSMWPPNHKYETFNVTDFVSSATDNCNSNLLSSVVIASVTSDELDDNPNGGDGNTTNDIVIAANCKSVQLRSERDGNLDGRVYTITFRVTDSAGNVRTATAKVVVPHDQGNGGAVDSGPHNTVNGNCP
jgi:CSLREA domain-containing protein